VEKEGERLKRAVLLSPLTATKLAKKLDISRGQLYLLYKEDVIPEKYKIQLKSLGIDMEKVDVPSTNKSSSFRAKDENELNLLRVRVEYLEKINHLLEDQLEQYKAKVKKG
jgi:hypothetical protein